MSSVMSSTRWTNSVPRLLDEDEILDVCPLCEAEQTFTRQLREVDDYLVEFWSCKFCPWKRDGAPTTRELEQLRRQYREAQARTAKETTRHGQPSISTLLMKKRLRERMIEQLGVLKEKLNA